MPSVVSDGQEMACCLDEISAAFGAGEIVVVFAGDDESKPCPAWIQQRVSASHAPVIPVMLSGLDDSAFSRGANTLAQRLSRLRLMKQVTISVG